MTVPTALRSLPGTLMLLALLAAPAHTASVRGSFAQPPYYDGRLRETVKPAAHVGVTCRTVPGSLDLTPDRSPALAGLLDSLRVAIGQLRRTTALPVDVRLAGQPDVRFGARRGGTSADGIPRSPDEIDTDPPRRMVFEVEGPSKPWREQVRAAASSAGARAVISVQLGFDEHWVRQKNLKGEKTIDLGTGRSQPVPWLTSLDDPVQVLQLTGALTNPDGRVLRVGAEGLLARRTGMAASVLGAQEVLTEEDLRSLGDATAGEPVWRVALRALIAGLLEDPKAR